MFSKQDKAQIREHGISLKVIEEQIERFRSGFPFADILRPADPKRGILQYAESEQKQFADAFDSERDHLNITKFVPASGAATRMFKDLYALQERLSGQDLPEQQRIITSDSKAGSFFSRLEAYPFYEDLVAMRSGPGTWMHEKPLETLQLLLSKEGLGYGSLPKGLLKFHTYRRGSRTAFGEHLVESPAFASSGSEVHMHFTVSPEHEEGFRDLQELLLPVLERSSGLTYHISYSFQKPSTDTIAVDMDNQPFRDASGRLVFRPGGHGALLENLDAIDSDLVFISNIDNVAPERTQPARIASKKFLGGVLLKYREEVFRHIEELGTTGGKDPGAVDKALQWMKEIAFIDVPGEIENAGPKEQAKWALKKLDRPIRVCGMVKNEGEPGGGPFFMRNTGGEISLQIVELSQIDTSDQAKQAIVSESTHFNPVDLVCSIKKKNGEKYRLSNYRDPETGFISHKSMAGRDLKALELPGLWNGSMSDWLTLFVEVPSVTFSPVKTVFDLVRSEHLEDPRL